MVLIPHVEIPLDPDAPEARRWLVEELSKPEYTSAQPTPFDLAMQAIRDWIASLFEGATGIPGPLLALLAVLAARRSVGTSRRSWSSNKGAAADAGDWPLAIEERFRAIVRGVVDRDLVRVHPGTTAHGVSDAASVPFPDHAGALRTAAADFDAVRYLGRPGSRERYDELTRLDLALEAAVPEHAESAAPVGAPR